MEKFFYKIESLNTLEDRKILPMLFPNYVNIFPVKLYDEDLEFFFKNDKQFFLNILTPVLKNKWNKQSLQYNMENEDIILEDKDDESYTVFSVENLEIKDDELYSYNMRNSPDFADFRFCKGLYKAAEYLGIITGHADLERNQISIFTKDSNFRKINLKSLELDFQLKLFNYFINKDIILITGGTGIGKTSQIPKVFFWFDTLFSYDKNTNENYHTLLSLPKIQLVNYFADNFNSSINCSSRLNKYYYSSDDHVENNETTKIIVSTNKISSKRFLHENSNNKISTVILDEIHESDIHTPINISLLKKFKNIFGCIVLMSATPGNHLMYLSNFFGNVQLLSLPNIQLYKIHTYNMYNEKLNEVTMLKNAIKKYTPKNKEIGLVFSYSTKHIKSLNEKLSETFRSIKFIEIYSKKEDLKKDLDSLDDINEPIILLSTNLLESSVTIKKLKYVYDLGKVYIKDHYIVELRKITEESALQRKGRVGRVSEGNYIKLYKDFDTHNMLYYYFLYPIIIYDKAYNLKSLIYGFDEFIKNRYNKQTTYFEEFYKDKNINNLLNLYNNNLCTALESLAVYMSNWKLSEYYKSLETASYDIDLKTLDLPMLKKIALIINKKVLIAYKNFAFFKEENKAYGGCSVRYFKVVGRGKDLYFVTPFLLMRI